MGVQRVFDATVASFSTLSGEVDLGGAYDMVALIVPTMASNSQVHIQGTDTSGGTYRRIFHPVVNSTAAGAPIALTVVSSVTNAIVPIQVPAGLRYMKIETTAIVSFSAGFKIIVGTGSF
jgi:hypothetical protein